MPRLEAGRPGCKLVGEPLGVRWHEVWVGADVDDEGRAVNCALPCS